MSAGSSLGTKLRHAIGVDRGGTNLRVGLVRNDGQIVRLLQRRAPLGSRMDLNIALADLVELLHKAVDLACASGMALDGIGIATGGQVTEDGVITGTSGPRRQPWTPVPLRDLLEKQLTRDLPIHVVVDSQGAAWGEYLYGAGRGTKHMACFTVGTGIGGGLIVDGKLSRGAFGSAGHVGFISVDMHGCRCPCGAMGCIEDAASGTAIAKAARRALEEGCHSTVLELAGGDAEAVTSEMVFEAARAGDKVAAEVVTDAAYALGIAIGSLMHMFNPEVIVVGGGVAEQGDFFLAPVRCTVLEYVMPAFSTAPIRAAELGNLAGVIGAAALCWQEGDRG